MRRNRPKREAGFALPGDRLPAGRIADRERGRDFARLGLFTLKRPRNFSLLHAKFPLPTAQGITAPAREFMAVNPWTQGIAGPARPLGQNATWREAGSCSDPRST